MKKLNSKGSSPLHIILILVIVGLIAGVGYYVYNSQRETKQSLDNAANSQADPQKSERQELADESEETEKDSAEGYFTIKELGVKFKLTSTLEGLYYYIGNEGKTAYFSLEELKDTNCAADLTSQIALSRYTDQDFENDEQIAAIKDKAKKIGNYYYLSTGGQSACSEDNAIQDRASEMRAEISQLLPDALVENQ